MSLEDQFTQQQLFYQMLSSSLTISYSYLMGCAQHPHLLPLGMSSNPFT
jgi:hypothetical protein